MNLTKPESIAAGLRSHRAKKDVTQREAAEEIGTSPSTMSAWENQGGIGLADAWAAADYYYGCSLDELAGRPEPRTPQADASPTAPIGTNRSSA